MESLDFLIRDLALILVVASVTTIVFKKIKQPLVLGYVLAGFLASNNFSLLPTIVDAENIGIWSELGVIFLMFALGLEFSFHKIANIGGGAIVTAATVITSMIFVGYGVGNLLGWSSMDSIFLGGMISMSSTMIILKVYDELNIKERKSSQLVIGTLIIEDVAAIFMMIILSTLATSKVVSGTALFSEISVMMIYLVLWLLLGIYLIPSALKAADKYLNDETLLIVSLGLCLAMVVIANYMGFSSALGAFIAGSILAGTVQAERIEEIVKPIKDLFGAIFFVSVGMLVNPSLIAEYAVPILILTVVTIFGQMLFSGLGATLSGQSLRTAVGVGTSMVQIGEFSFIIASLGSNLGVTSDFLYPIIVSVSVITTFITPMIIKQADSVYVILSRHLPKQTKRKLKIYTSDKQSENEKDPEWKQYLQRYVTRTVITTILLVCTYMIGVKMLPAFLMSRFEMIENAKLISGFLTICCMTPIINMMSYRKDPLFAKLWLKNETNRFPLVAFKCLRLYISLLLVMSTIKASIDIPEKFLWLISFVIVGFSVKSDFMASRSIKIETKFISNFNQKLLEEKRKSRGVSEGYRWLDETLLVEKYEVKKLLFDDPERIFFAKQSFGVQIIKIIRNDMQINNPGPYDGIFEGDTIVVLGKEYNLDSFEMAIRKVAEVSERSEPISLRNYTYKQIFTYADVENHLQCIAVNVTQECPFCNKTIQMSEIKEEYSGFVIGIDRDGLSIVGPNKNTAIEEGDILWVLGAQKTIDLFLKDGILK